MKKIILIIIITISYNLTGQEIFLLNNMILLENFPNNLVFKNKIPENWLIETSTIDTIIYPPKWKVKKDLNGKFITYSNLSRPKKNKTKGYYYTFEFELNNKIVYLDSIPDIKINFDFNNSPIIYKEKNEIIIYEIRNHEWYLIFQNNKKKIYKHQKRSDYLFTNMHIKDYELILQFVFNSIKGYDHYPLPDKFTSKELPKLLAENRKKYYEDFKINKKRSMEEILKHLTLIAMNQNTINNRVYLKNKTP